MLATAAPSTPDSSLGLQVAIVTLTCAGLGGLAVGAVGFATTAQFGGGCALGGMAAIVGFFMVAIFLIVWLALGALATAGMILMWSTRRLGTALVLAANLLAMGAYIYVGPASHQAAWDAATVTFALASGAGAALAGWQLLAAIQRPLNRALAAIAIVLVASPMVWLYGVALSRDLSDAIITTPPAAVAAAC